MRSRKAAHLLVAAATVDAMAGVVAHDQSVRRAIVVRLRKEAPRLRDSALLVPVIATLAPLVGHDEEATALVVSLLADSESTVRARALDACAPLVDVTDELGPMVYAENEGEVFLGRSITKQVNVSEQTMQKVDHEIRKIIDEQYANARKLIEDNQDKMHAMAKALLEWETIDADQIDELQRTLTVARHRMHWRRGEAGNPAEPAKVTRLPFVA